MPEKSTLAPVLLITEKTAPGDAVVDFGRSQATSQQMDLLIETIEKRAMMAMRIQRAMGAAVCLFSFVLIAQQASIGYVAANGSKFKQLWNATGNTMLHAGVRVRHCYQTIRFVYQVECQLNDLESKGDVHYQGQTAGKRAQRASLVLLSCQKIPDLRHLKSSI